MNLKTQKIAEQNKLIAEFMGLKIQSDGISYFDNNYTSLKKYNLSWDALMPVIKKLDAWANEKLTVEEYFNYRDTEWKMINNPSKYDIENVHKQVFQFIEFIKNYDETL